MGHSFSLKASEPSEASPAAASRKAFLNEKTLWRVSFKLQKQGCKDVEALIRVRFIEDRGYEPPQGRVFVEDDFNGLVRVTEEGYTGFRWTLSEDRAERKDGLWIWGLFEEPKYPFLYFSLAVYDDVILPSGESESIFGGVGVPGSRLNLRFNHIRDSERGTSKDLLNILYACTLSAFYNHDIEPSVVLSAGEVTYQLDELVKADPLGIGGTVNVGDILSAGKVDIQPVF